MVQMREYELIFPPVDGCTYLSFDGRKFKFLTIFILKSNLTHPIEIVLLFAVTYLLNLFLIKSSTEILPLIPDFDVHSHQNNCQVKT